VQQAEKTKTGQIEVMKGNIKLVTKNQSDVFIAGHYDLKDFFYFFPTLKLIVMMKKYLPIIGTFDFAQTQMSLLCKAKRANYYPKSNLKNKIY
jgi:hypothetical protein